MKVTLIGHASILIETSGVAILSDPWWHGPCFGAQWWNYPLPALEVMKDRHIDYIYVSHGHHDHFHPGTLRRLSKTAKVLVGSTTGLAEGIRELGFAVITVDDAQPLALGEGNVRCRIMETHHGDTLMSVEDGAEVCVNLNDALHSAPREVQRAFVARLRSLYPRIDYLFCGYGVASHFPNCYVIPGMDKEATAAKRQAHFNREWVHIVGALKPRYGFPFAADVALLEDDLFWANEALHNPERPTDVFDKVEASSGTVAMDIGPGFCIEGGKVTADVRRKPLRGLEIAQTCAEQVARANRYGSVGIEHVQEVAKLLQEKLNTCAPYLVSYERDYRFLIRFRGSDFGICIEKRRRSLTSKIVSVEANDPYDLVYKTRLPYLKWALTRPYGDEILFVGSGGVFEYSDALAARFNLHRELISLLRTGVTTPSPRPKSGLLGQTKRLVKRMIGRADHDLYDLNHWIVFAARSRKPRSSDIPMARSVSG